MNRICYFLPLQMFCSVVIVLFPSAIACQETNPPVVQTNDTIAQKINGDKFIWYDKHLWQLDYLGTLHTYVPGFMSKAEVKIDGVALDIHLSATGQLWVVTTNVREGWFKVWSRSNEVWRLLASYKIAVRPPNDEENKMYAAQGRRVESVQEYYMGIAEYQLHPVIVTDERIRMQNLYGKPEIHPTPQSWQHYGGVISAGLTHNRMLYLGYNNGEFGGGLSVMDLKTGQSSDFVKTGADDAPVTGIAIDPRDSTCVLVTEYPYQFDHGGTLFRACGKKLDVLIKQTVNHDEPLVVTGMAATRKEIWLSTRDGLYYSADYRTFNLRTLPKHENTDDLEYSRELPGLLIIYGITNGQYVISGNMPQVLIRRD